MDANYSNGSSIYHGFTTNLRKRFSSHYEFLASYTWSHAIDDSTDLQSTLTPQDSYYPGLDRSTSLFDQRHRFVFSGVYQTGKLGGNGFVRKFFSDWTFAPLLDVASGRPFNIVTGERRQSPALFSDRPAQYDGRSRLRSRLHSKYSPTGRCRSPAFFALRCQPGPSQRCCNSTEPGTQCGNHSLDGLQRFASSPSAFTSASASAWT